MHASECIKSLWKSIEKATVITNVRVYFNVHKFLFFRTQPAPSSSQINLSDTWQDETPRHSDYCDNSAVKERFQNLENATTITGSDNIGDPAASLVVVGMPWVS